MVAKIVISLFLSGLFFGSGPCVASCGPMLITYIVGTKKNTLKALSAYLLFSVSRVFVYVVLGAFFYFVGQLTVEKSLEQFSRYIVIAGGCFIIAVGLLMILGKSFEFKVCQMLGKRLLENDKKSIVIMGLVIGVLPCAPLIAILSYIGLVAKTWLSSAVYSFSFGLGTIVSPLLLLALAAGLVPKLVIKNESYYRIFTIICGVIIIILGAQLIYRVF